MSHASHEPDTTVPELVVLDVNETLSDLTPMADAFVEVGLDGRDVAAWFAGVLRDAFALTVLGDNPSLAEIGISSLRVRLQAAGCSDVEAGARQVMDRFAHLDPHGDVVPGLQALAALGCRIVTLSNGSSAVARALLEDTAAGAVIEDYASVADAAAWKPAAAAYEHVLAGTSVPAGRAMLVAAHPWDVAGARRAGLRTAWINRDQAVYPDHLAAAEVEATSFLDLAARLRTGLGAVEATS